MLGKKIRSRVLIQWIILGCTALLIPVVCSIMCYFVSSNLVLRKIDDSNKLALMNLQYNIDSKLENLVIVSKQFQSDNNFSTYKLNVDDSVVFGQRVRKCNELLKHSLVSNPDVDILLYLPRKDFFIGSKTANDSSKLYRSLNKQSRISISEDEWIKLFTMDTRNQFFVSSDYSYENYGKESIVYATSLLYSEDNPTDMMYVSTPISFVDEVLHSLEYSQLYIIDDDNNVIASFGNALKLNKINLDKDQMHLDSKITIKEGKDSFIARYNKSNINDWKYVICTPKSVYLKDLAQHRLICSVVIILGMIVGIILVIYFQRVNYKPLNNIVELMADNNQEETNEFQFLENNINKLYAENKTMSSSLENRRETDIRNGFLACITHVDLNRKNNEFIKYISANRNQKSYCLSVIDLNLTDVHLNADVSKEMLSFLIENICDDVFDKEYEIIKTIDSDICVLLFIVSKEDKNNCEAKLIEKFNWIYDFFDNKVGALLRITIGDFFEEHELLEAVYAELKEKNNQRLYTMPGGVALGREVLTVDYSTEERIEYYSKSFISFCDYCNISQCKELCHKLFIEFNRLGFSEEMIFYNVISITYRIINILNDEINQTDEFAQLLHNLREAKTQERLNEYFLDILQAICKRTKTESNEGKNISEEVIKYVKINYADCNMNISTIADTMGIAPRQLSKIFKEETGLNLLNYINQERIDHAKQLLITTDKTIEQISVETGFGNDRTFRRNFQKETGVSPAQYRVA